MFKFILKNNLYLMAALAVGVGVFVGTHWASMPFSQRMIGLFFIAIVMHLWEEGMIPGDRRSSSRSGLANRPPVGRTGYGEALIVVTRTDS